MNIATIYTLYGRRAGAELCFEKIVESISHYRSDISWTIYCNQQAKKILEEYYPFVKTVYIPFLDNQYKKAFWLEFLSHKHIQYFDCFWNPSGCNHFPGHWTIPVITTFHDLGEYHIRNKYGLARTYFRKQICIPRSIKRSNLFVAVSYFTAKDMNKYLKLPLESVNVIYNGNSPYSSMIRPNFLSIEKWGLNNGEYLFTPGRTDYVGKGLDILLKSFRDIHKYNPNLKLVLTGPKGEGHELFLNDLSKDNYLNSHILYLGRVDDNELISLYNGCLATVISSRFEGFGFPILEAMANNVPIICSDAGSLPEIAGNAALLFRSGDSKSLYETIVNLIKYNADEKNELIARGKQRLQMFTWEKCARSMISLFEKANNLFIQS